MPELHCKRLIYQFNKGVADTQITHDGQNDGQTHKCCRRARLAMSTVKLCFAKGDASSI